MVNKFNNIFMFIIFIMFLSLGFYTLIRNPKNISETENRVLSKFEHFLLNNYIDGTYQKNTENAFLDQFIGSQTIRKNMKKNIFLSKKTEKYFCSKSYVYLDKELYKYNCEDYILDKYNENINYENYLKIMSEKYNEINGLSDTYFYYITTSGNYDFLENKMIFDFPNKFNEYFKYKDFDYLKINSFDDYKNYFYKTDYHWNYKGAYQGYKDIMKMIDKDLKLLKPIDEIKFNTNFYGSKSKSLSNYDIKEIFTVYKFDYPDYKIYINKTLGNYNLEKSYFNHNYTNELGENHYSKFYGWDRGEIILDTSRNKLDNVLVLSNSFAHPINKLLASHFNKTYIVDLRHYEKELGMRFNIKDYIKVNNIDKIIVIMDIMSMSTLYSYYDI